MKPVHQAWSIPFRYSQIIATFFHHQMVLVRESRGVERTICSTGTSSPNDPSKNGGSTEPPFVSRTAATYCGIYNRAPWSFKQL